MKLDPGFVEVFLLLGSFVLTILIGIVGWFVRKLVVDFERMQVEFNRKLGRLEEQFSNWRVTVEQTFVNFETFETLRTEFRNNFLSIFEKQEQHGNILARLDERSRGDDRLAQVLQALNKGRK